MKITVLADNIAPKEKGLKGEWGLSLLIEHEGKTVLLDTGASSLFARNAEKLSLDLTKVDAGVLSHSHFDHSDGMEEIFRINKNADFYLSSECKENCYGKMLIFTKYIGIRKGIMEKYSKRLKYVHSDREIFPGMHLIRHKTEGLEALGQQANLFRRVKDGRLLPDNFSHEQSLVVESEKGLVIFNSCSHGGADNILNEISATFPDKKIYGFIGGLHLYRSPKEEVARTADILKNSSLELIVTGHCTGKKPYAMLKESLGNKVEQLYVGKVIEI